MFLIPGKMIWTAIKKGRHAGLPIRNCEMIMSNACPSSPPTGIPLDADIGQIVLYGRGRIPGSCNGHDRCGKPVRIAGVGKQLPGFLWIERPWIETGIESRRKRRNDLGQCFELAEPQGVGQGRPVNGIFDGFTDLLFGQGGINRVLGFT